MAASVPSSSDRSCPYLTYRQLEEMGMQEQGLS